MKLSNTALLTIVLSIKLLYPQSDNNENIKKYIDVADKIVRTTLNEQPGYQWLDELCKIGPRLSGSNNSLTAIHWADEKMQSLGFDKVWLQSVMVPHWERGNIEKALITESNYFLGRELRVIALGGSVGTDEDGVTAEVLEVKNFDELKQKKELAKGKIIFFSRPLDMGLINTFAGYGGAVDQRSRGAIEAAKYGAIGIIIRSVTTKHDNVPHTGVMHYVDSLPKIPSVAAGYLDADFLSDALKKDPHLKITIKLNCKTFPDEPSYNLIGEITGSELPNEVIVVGGHFDSWDQGTGAHDDGAGCVQSMEAVYLLKKLNIKPKRTIRCVLFINEENGSRGGIEYGTYSDTSKEKHIAAIESDRGGFTPVGFDVDSDSLTLLKIQSWLPILKKASIEWIDKGGSGVDVSHIKNAGALIGYVPDDQRYFDFHHSANDVYEAVNPRELELGSAAITILAYLLSEEGL